MCKVDRLYRRKHLISSSKHTYAHAVKMLYSTDNASGMTEGHQKQGRRAEHPAAAANRHLRRRGAAIIYTSSYTYHNQLLSSPLLPSPMSVFSMHILPSPHSANLNHFYLELKHFSPTTSLQRITPEEWLQNSYCMFRGLCIIKVRCAVNYL